MASRHVSLASALGLFVMITLAFAPAVSGQQFIVEDGEPRAEIVVPEHAARSVTMAAKELQHYVEQMSGATLPIRPAFVVGGEKPERVFRQYAAGQDRMPVKIYLGTSFYTDRLGVNAEGLDWGAYRMKSGDGWLALVGDDVDFMPVGIWGRNRGLWRSEDSKAWDEATGGHHWGNPVGRKLWNRYNRTFDLWSFDHKGTLNATYAFLRQLGVRWYMPGELGEIVPQKKSIELPNVDETVRPAFKIRKVSFMRYGNGDHINPEIKWSLRQSMNYPYGFQDYHGLANVTRPQHTRETHPEFYALYNGVRDTESRTANPCLSSKGLFDETVVYARFILDMYGVDSVSVWPDDGFTAICQCQRCKGRDKPALGRQGILSDYVWDFVNRVAKEVEKTHPDKLISGGAYSTYWLPPEDIDELNDNVMVFIVNARRRYDMPEADLKAKRAAVRKWGELTGGKVVSFMNYGGAANTPRIFADDIKALSGLAMGEDMWVAHHRGGLAQHGFNHLNYYISARLWWNPDLDVDALLAEYYDRFYGPAGSAMEQFINYFEKHQKEMRNIDSAPIIRKALDLFEQAQEQVEPDSVYGKRIAMFSEGLSRVRSFYDKIKDGRDNPPVYQLSRLDGQINVDGALDEAFWDELPATLKKIRTGEEAEYATHFKIGLKDNNLYVAVKCMDDPGDPVNAAPTERKDDSSLWQGDVVELLLETPMHSYYQIAINPDGAVCDLDRRVNLTKGFNWSAEATVATQVNTAEGYWTVEMRVPFTPSTQDPLHEVVGPRPAEDAPWYFNLCRQRTRDGNRAMFAFSPTGERGFHNILEFGKLTAPAE